MIISKQSIAREYAAIRQHETVRDSIEWTAAKLGVTEQQVIDIIFEKEAA